MPSPGAASDSGIRFALLAASELRADELAARLELDPAAVRMAHEPAAAATSTERAPAHEAPAPAADAEAATLKSLTDTVRVDIKKLDELMNLVGELARERSALRALAEQLAGARETARAAADLDKIRRGLDRKVQELQAGVLDVRMVPLRQVFDKLARVARRLRLDLAKDVRLEHLGRGHRARQADRGGAGRSAHAPGAERLRPRHRVGRRAAQPGQAANRV